MHGSCGIEFQERYEEVYVFLWTWGKDVFGRVWVAALDRYGDGPHLEVAVPGHIVAAPGPGVSVVSLNGGSNVLGAVSTTICAERTRKKLIDDSIFDLRLFKRCLQRTTSIVFGNLDAFAMTEIFFNWLNGAEARDWTSSLAILKEAILTNDLSMTHLLVCGQYSSHTVMKATSFVVSCLVVRSSSFCCINTISDCI